MVPIGSGSLAVIGPSATRAAYGPSGTTPVPGARTYPSLMVPGTLHVERLSEATADAHHPADRLVMVHGFTQTARCWGPFGTDLAADHDVWAVDAPGHGDSAGVEADLVDGATLLGATGGRATYLGYSMGGRLALHLALSRPALTERLVLIGATAGIEDEDERSARKAADEALAAHIEDIGVDAFLEEWLALPLFAGLPLLPPVSTSGDATPPSAWPRA